jgi:Tetratricopeptide repeat
MEKGKPGSRPSLVCARSPQPGLPSARPGDLQPDGRRSRKVRRYRWRSGQPDSWLASYGRAGRHDLAVELLAESARTAGAVGRRRQKAWSAGVMARSLLLAGDPDQALAAAERSIESCDRDRWNAFLPWPQALRAHCLAAADRWDEARDDAEQAYAPTCQPGDPCWEGMAGPGSCAAGSASRRYGSAHDGKSSMNRRR